MVGKVTQYTTIAFISTIALSGVAYVAWWDYKRRNDPLFRKKIRKEHKKAHRHAKLADERAKQAQQEDLRDGFEKIKAETVPTLAEEREQYFMQNVAAGEQLSTMGPASYVTAALSFYRALRVYPSPVELIMIYQKTVPEPIFKLVMDLSSMEVSNTTVTPDLGVDDDAPVTSATSSTSGTRRGARRGASVASGDERTGPPSEASSQDWETLTDPGSQGASATATPPRR